MPYNLRPPHITGNNDKEKLAQLQTYLHQLVGELEYALNTIEANCGNAPNVYQDTNKNK